MQFTRRFMKCWFILIIDSIDLRNFYGTSNDGLKYLVRINIQIGFLIKIPVAEYSVLMLQRCA